MAANGDEPTRYLLATKYIEMLQRIVQAKDTDVNLMPPESCVAQVLTEFGVNSVLPGGKRD